MRTYILSCTAVLVLAACASHPQRCGSRPTPINRGPIEWHNPSGIRRAVGRIAQVPHS